jgi:hypothetical protein
VHGDIVTLHFPDVSSYTPNVDPAAYPILIARATLSTTLVDKSYATFKAKAAAAGTVFLAYHWLNHGNLVVQAKHALSVVGPDVPLMLDAEDEPGNTGFNGPLTVADIVGFATAYRMLGGTVSLAYLPAWYWSGAMSMADLSPLSAAGLHLVSSNYPPSGYSENGPGWAAYGGVTPVQWQYTSTPIDLNAFRGTVAEYVELVGVRDMTPEEHQWLHDLKQRSDWGVSPPTVTPEQRANGITPASETGGVPVPGSAMANLAGPATLALTEADRQAIVDGVAAQIGGKLDQVLTRLDAAGHALES